MKKPNLFSFATSELSQDAFICWLAQWADKDYESIDSILHQIATDFLQSLLKKKDYEVEIESVTIYQQKKYVDILIEINNELDSKCVILIEDKVHSNILGEQLKTYFGETIKTYAEPQIISIFFKTGYVENFSNLENFVPYLRKDFLLILEKGKSKGVKNEIFLDFYEHLLKIDNAIKQFHLKKVVEWQYHDWVGFYSKLMSEKHIEINDSTNFGQVLDRFCGLWWMIDERIDYYLQLEGNKLVYKMESLDKDKGYEKALRWFEYLKECSKDEALKIEKSNWRTGKTMTVAKNEAYIVLNENGILNFEETVNNLKIAERIYVKALEGFEVR